jgi:GTP-binding protein
MERRLPQVAIVGRPNVGKSTLFNRMCGSRRAIVDSVAGSTRDRNKASVDWAGKTFEVVDTGGVLESVATPLDEQVAAQVEIAIGDADLVCWVVDGRAGLLPEERYLATKLRPLGERVLLAVNKIDSERRFAEAMEFHRLGFPELFEISAEHGLGVADLMDAIAAKLPLVEDREASDEIRIAIAGRPNVGKSSLLNRIAGEERAVVSPVAGTTRDAVDTLVEVEGQDYRFVDTAGIRRRGKLPGLADQLSVIYAERAIERAHIVLLILDATAGVTTEDASIGGKIADSGRGVVLVFNKWDVVEEREERAKELEQEAREDLPHLDFAPIVFVSAKSGRGVPGIFPRIRRVREEQLKKVSTPELNRFLDGAVARLPPRAKDGKEARLFYITQAGVVPPRFLVFANKAQKDLDISYPRYLSRRLRETFGFEGTPIRVTIRRRQTTKSNNRG